MSKVIGYEYILTWNPNRQTRINFECGVDNGTVVGYMVQLEFNDNNMYSPNWRQVARFDTSHSFMHMDHYHKDGTKQKKRGFPNFSNKGQELKYAEKYLETREINLLKAGGWL